MVYLIKKLLIVFICLALVACARSPRIIDAESLSVSIAEEIAELEVKASFENTVDILIKVNDEFKDLKKAEKQAIKFGKRTNGRKTIRELNSDLISDKIYNLYLNII